MKRLIIIISILFLFNFAYSQTRAWTIMCYLAADNNSEMPTMQYLNELEEIGSDTNVSIIVQIDRWETGCESIYNYPDDLSDGDWKTCRRYYIEYDTDPINIGSTYIDIGEVDMSKKETMIDFFDWVINWEINNNCKADRYLLWTASYGWGWRGSQIDYMDNNSPNNCCDCCSMSTINLADAISHFYTLSGKKIDIIFFTTCLMNELEILYQIKDYVKFVVGSEELIHDELNLGVKEIIQNFVINYSSDSKELAKQIVQMKPDGFNTLSAIDVSLIDTLLIPYDDLIFTLLEYDYTYWSNEIHYIRKTCSLTTFGYMGYLRDLGDFGRIVSLFPDFPQIIKDKGANLLQSINNVVIENKANTNVYPNAYGISFFFPDLDNIDYFTDYPAWKAEYDRLSICSNFWWDEYLPANASLDSEFPLFLENALEYIKVYPNPLRKSEYNPLNLENIKVGTELIIYNICGEKILEMGVDRSYLTFPLHIVNKQGKRVSSGIYFFRFIYRGKERLIKVAVLN
jgi:hypothetical protein